MKVKILLFPLAIVIALSLSIFWIQPEIASVRSFLTQKEEAEKTLEKTEKIISNIETLFSSLGGNPDDEAFVLKYLPRVDYDDRLLDEVNYLAGDSGLFLSSVAFERSSNMEAAMAAAAAELAKEQSEGNTTYIPVSGDQSSDGSGTPNLSPEAYLSFSDVAVSAHGKYDQIKAFMEKMYRADHFQSFRSVEIVSETDEKKSEMDPLISFPVDVLRANIIVRFSALKMLHVERSSRLDEFSEPEFKLDTIQALRERVSNQLASLDAISSQRGNPFFR